MSFEEWKSLALIAIPALAAATGLLAYVRVPGADRAAVKDLAEILSLTPADHTLRPDLEALFAERVGYLVRAPKRKQRKMPFLVGIAGSLIFFGVALQTYRGDLKLAAVFAFIVGIYIVVLIWFGQRYLSRWRWWRLQENEHAMDRDEQD